MFKAATIDFIKHKREWLMDRYRWSQDLHYLGYCTSADRRAFLIDWIRFEDFIRGRDNRSAEGE